MNLQSLIRHACKQASKSIHRHKLGAVIFRKGKIISKGYNKTNRGISDFGGFWKGSCHAEIAALIHSRCDLRGASIMVMRLNLRCSRPCAPCMAALKEAGLRTVFYHDVNSTLKAETL